jgi:hypothetical protein
MIGLSAVVFGSALMFHTIQAIVIERIAGLPFALGFILLMRPAKTVERSDCGEPPDLT